MRQPGRWIEREWTFTTRPSEFAALLERVRGTAARVEDLFAGVADEALSDRPGRGWSAKEHVGHLVDLGELDSRRLSEFLAGVPLLSPADMENRRTEAAGHADRPARMILRALREHRQALVQELERLDDAELEHTALHPRLNRPMRLIDWVEFVADHDDHHLALARNAIRAAAGDRESSGPHARGRDRADSRHAPVALSSAQGARNGEGESARGLDRQEPLSLQVPAAEPCPFCRFVRGREPCAFVLRRAGASAFVNPTQYERGALLVIPDRHVSTILETTPADVSAVSQLVRSVSRALYEAYRPIGLNVFQNNGRASGQHVPHYHVHVVPRYTPDEPRRLFRQADFPALAVEDLGPVALEIRAALEVPADSASEPGVPEPEPENPRRDPES